MLILTAKFRQMKSAVSLAREKRCGQQLLMTSAELLLKVKFQILSECCRKSFDLTDIWNMIFFLKWLNNVFNTQKADKVNETIVTGDQRYYKDIYTRFTVTIVLYRPASLAGQAATKSPWSLWAMVTQCGHAEFYWFSIKYQTNIIEDVQFVLQ